ncbi:MAG: TrkH family potassium uptake protein [Clostridiales Family XIII bacterium]|jgi:trk system potassium uptake protein TrkH|nr:TrkH family potassium uptake protein [Clostridiales Family XIII bacterium]
MGINYLTVLRIAGFSAGITGIAILPSLAVSFLCAEYDAAARLAPCAAVLILAALLGFRFSAPGFSALLHPGAAHLHALREHAEPGPRAVILLSVLWWLFSSVFGAVPYLACGLFEHAADAFFESVSGFTTTGATLIGDVEALPRSLLLWRSTTGWLGGLEILFVAAVLIPFAAGAHPHPAHAETAAGLPERPFSKNSGSGRMLLAIYSALTLLLFLLLSPGMKPFDALIHSMGTISTGGFSNFNDGAAHFSGTSAAWILTVFMMLAALSSMQYFRMLSRRWGAFVQDAEMRYFLAMACVAAILLSLSLHFAPSAMRPARSAGSAFFEAAATLSTTGYSVADYDLWPTFCQATLFLLMFVGGCSASPAGGMKVFRIVILFKLIHRNISLRLHPNAVVPIKFDGKTPGADWVSAVAGHALLYIAVFFSGTLLLSLDGADMLSSLSGVAACMGNIGPGFAQVGPGDGYTVFSAGAKLLLSLLMIAGRLELTAAVMLLTPLYWSGRK